MRSTIYLTASALATLATAQTFTDCNPTKKTCPNNPAMPATFETDFKAGKDAVKGWKQTAGSLNYASGGAEFTVAKKGDAPTIQTEGYLHFGRIEVKTKAAPGAGIISSIVLQSDDLDEVDWEFVGSVNSQAQMNYFGKGNTTTYDRMIPATVSNVQEIHTYTLDWTAEKLEWIIDGASIRTLMFKDANNGNNYPQTPSNVRIGIWSGGDSENEGTREWAGGKVDYSKAPFTQLVESVKITNYNPGKEYQWTDKTGSYQSIKVIDAGDKDGSDVNSQVIKPSATASGAAGLASEVNHPTVTGSAGLPAASGNSTSGPGSIPSGPGSAPSPSNGTVYYPNGTAVHGEEPCECVETVTLTGYPPEQTPTESVQASTYVPVAPPVSQTVEASTYVPVSPPASSVAPPPESAVTPISPPPVTTAPATSAVPPYPSAPGIVTDSAPAPSAAFPSAPTGAIPTGNATATPPAELFPGAASHNTAGALFGLVLAVMAFAL